jgi:hypothetical protein
LLPPGRLARLAGMFDFSPGHWALAIVGACCIGVSKTGIAGLGVLTVAIYANVLPAKLSTGIILPMLIAADLVAVAVYRRHAQWSRLWRLFPWVAVGVVAGYFAMDRVDDRQVRKLIGLIVVTMVALHGWSKRRGGDNAVPHTHWFAALTGLLAGYTTMMANAAGPIMTLYLLAIGLPKLEFLGTGAWFFLIINVFKVPFSANLGLITGTTLQFNAVLLPAVLAGTWLGKLFIPRLNQRWFQALALGLTLLAGLRLLW